MTDTQVCQTKGLHGFVAISFQWPDSSPSGKSKDVNEDPMPHLKQVAEKVDNKK